jgi:hypothetical protein
MTTSGKVSGSGWKIPIPVFRLADDMDRRHQTFQGTPDKYPTVCVCMCTRKCMTCYDITDKNTTPMNEHLKNAHKLEKKMEHGKKTTQRKKNSCHW